jgi:hypothetical protein
MNSFRYQLDDSSRKFECPGCNRKRLVRFIDQETRDYLELKFGRCDREQNCGYFHSPYQVDSFKREQINYQKPSEVKYPPKYIPKALFEKSLGNYDQNNFIRFMRRHFDSETISKVNDTYKIGTSLKITGGCIFYQIDIKGKVRRGKIIVYNSETGNRGAINSVHCQLKIDKQYYPKWRFFGEHLLKDNDKPVAIVESEKTAVIASIYFPEFVWLATGTKSTLKPEYAQALKSRSITLFPDIGAYQDWAAKLEGFSAFCDISISNLLESKSGIFEKNEGLDLADYLISRRVGEFQ